MKKRAFMEQKKRKKFYIVQLSLFASFFVACFVSLYWFYYVFPYVTALEGYIEGRQVLVCPANDGKIISSSVKEGDFVKKGQLLFQLDDRLAQSERKQVIAKLDSLKEKKSFSQKLLDDSMKHYLDTRRKKDQSIATEKELISSLRVLEERKENFEELKNSLFIEEMKLEHLNQKLYQKSIEAPFDGVITKCHYVKGSYVEKKDPVLCLFDAKKIWGYAFVSEKDIHKIKLGSFAEICLDAYPSLILSGKVEFIAPMTKQVDHKKLIPIKISIDKKALTKDAFICNGMSANFKIKVK